MLDDVPFTLKYNYIYSAYSPLAPNYLLNIRWAHVITTFYPINVALPYVYVLLFHLIINNPIHE
jgi:hypothetical protein